MWSCGYNSRNDLTSIDYPTGTTDVSFTYDAVRDRTQMVDATGTTNYSYDEVNRLTSVTFPGSRTVGYGYSNAGNRATMTYPGGSNQVSYGYDAANNLTSLYRLEQQADHRTRTTTAACSRPRPCRQGRT